MDSWRRRGALTHLSLSLSLSLSVALFVSPLLSSLPHSLFPSPSQSRQDPVTKRYIWRRGDQRLDVERVLQTGASFAGKPKFGIWTKDVAQQVPRAPYIQYIISII